MKRIIRSGLFCLLVVQPVVMVAQLDQEVSVTAISNRFPDFTLDSVEHYPKKTISLGDFRGRWLLLEFFSRGCSACFTGLPKYNALRKELTGLAECILVGKKENWAPPTNNIRTQYEKFRKKLNLDIPVAYDEQLFKKLNISTMPHLVLIDPDGIQRAIVSPAETNENIRAFILGKKDHLLQKLDAETAGTQPSLNLAQPVLLLGNGAPDTAFLYRTVFAPGIPNAFPSAFFYRAPYGHLVQLVNNSLSDLYWMAYGDTINQYPFTDTSCYGIYLPDPIWEIADSSALITDLYTAKNLYCYSSVIPRKMAFSKQLAQTQLRWYLDQYFGYTCTVETRLLPCWNLIATEKARHSLATKGGAPLFPRDDEFADFTLRNVPVSKLILQLWRGRKDYPFIDVTGITGNIDLTVDAMIYGSTFEEMRQSLRKNGLDIVAGKKWMKAVVVRDRK